MTDRAALLQLHDWDELLFGGFYCLHCTPDDPDSLDDPIAWPCQPLRDAGVTDDEARELILRYREQKAAEEDAEREAKTREVQRRADTFNSRHPVGALVFAYPGARRDHVPSATRLVTRTRTKASVLGGHTEVVWVDGHSACIALTHVDVVSEAEWEAARTAEDEATTARAAEEKSSRAAADATSGQAPLIVYRAEHESIPMGLYTTREAAREHCMTLMRREACGHALDWRADEPSEEDSPEELWDLGDGPDDERFATGYVVTPLEVASKYDPEADE